MRKSKIKRLNKHFEWVNNLQLAGVQIDMDKLTTKKVYNRYFQREDVVARNPKEVKYIIYRLVSRNNLAKR